MAKVRAVADEKPTLYDRDYMLWLDQQAEALRHRRVDGIDWPHLLEEIEDMGRSQRRSVKSNLVVLLTHLLKEEFQAEKRSASWRASIVEHRQRLRDDFEDSPSLRAHAAAVFARAYDDARERASAETSLPPDVFPLACPYELDLAFDPAFRPGEPRSGAAQPPR